MILLIDTKTGLFAHAEALGFDVKDKETFSFDEIIGTEFVSVQMMNTIKTEFSSLYLALIMTRCSYLRIILT